MSIKKTKEDIEQLYIEGINNDVAPNVFAQTILNLFDVNNEEICHADRICESIKKPNDNECWGCDKWY